MSKLLKNSLITIGISFLCLMVVGQIMKNAMRLSRSQSIDRTEFARSIERADRDCPIPVVMGKGSVTGIKLENNYVTYYLSYDSDFFNQLSGLQNEEKVKEGLLMCFLCINAQGNDIGDLLMDVLIKFDYGLRVVISESALGKFECSATADEIKSLRERFRLNPHEALYNLLSLSVESERSSLPAVLDEGMVMTDFQLEDDNIAIEIHVDEDLYSISEMKAKEDFIKATMLEEGVNQPESKSLLDLCKVSHTGLLYRIVGNQTRKSFEMPITSEEIRRFVPTPANAGIQ